MKLATLAFGAALAALAWAPAFGPARAASSEMDGVKVVFQHAIPNVPGKTLTGVLVTYAPGGKSPAHHHARSAFITAYVLSGAIRSQADDGKVRVYHAGESWTEQPGAHHKVSENASATEPASLLAVFVADSSETELTTVDNK